MSGFKGLFFQNPSNFLLLVISALFFQCTSGGNSQNRPIKGWNILSANKENAMQVIDSAGKYNINHLQISHHNIMDLKDVRDSEKRNRTNDLIKQAHNKGIGEVVVWDHALYDLDYYPDRFKTGPDSTINLDNPELWNWVEEDYKKMLAKIPEVDGIVLTFIETGAHVEDQYSEKLQTESTKLAALVDSVANVVMDQQGLFMYIRTFIYTKQELQSVLNMVDQIQHEDIVVMMKEAPHDFFLTHPVNYYVEKINRPVMVEFDATHEFNGQGIVANTFVEKTLKRWKYFQRQSNVAGYVARTDRYGDTKIIGRPSEINLYTLKRVQEDTSITADQIYTEFIGKNYGGAAIKPIKKAFSKAEEIITSTFYSLGLNTANHSRLDFDYPSIYSRHVSGKWLKDPQTHIGHGVDTTLHYWKDIVNHMSPARYKKPGNAIAREAPWVLDSGWVQPKELMNKKYLKMIIAEKNHGVRLAKQALFSIRQSRMFVMDSTRYFDLYNTFNRTVITAQMRRGAAKAYYGYRIYCRGEAFRDPELMRIISEGIREMQGMVMAIENYPAPVPEGQWDWKNDAQKARDLIRKITREGMEPYGGPINLNSP